MRRAALLATAFGMLAVPAAASAADSVYWTNYAGVPFSFAALDGSGGGGVSPSAAPVSEHFGIALDPAAGRLYWINAKSPQGIFYSNFDGRGGGALNTAGATLVDPRGLSIDRARGRIYWANGGPANKISFANLDGAGGGDLNTAGATVDNPSSVAVDPAVGRVYWTNFDLNTVEVAYARTDGTGGADVTPVSNGNGSGVAIDPDTGRVFWSVFKGEIKFSMPDGSGAGTLDTTGATTNGVRQIAIDPVSNRIFWVNESPKAGISFASLAGAGAGDLTIPGAPLGSPFAVAILRTPAPIAPPTIAGRATIRSPLTCTTGSWAGDLPGSSFARAPTTFNYLWLRNGTLLEAAPAILRPEKAGSYTCHVTAINQAGTATQTSAAVTVRAGTATASRVARVKRGVALLKLRCDGIPCGGVARLKRGNSSLGKKGFAIAARKRKTVRVKLRPKARRLLAAAARDRLPVNLAGTGLRKRGLILKAANR